LLGILVDKIGKRGLLMFFSAFFVIFAHLTICVMEDSVAPFANNTIVYPLVAMGIFYAIYTTLIWPSISLVCDKKLRGTAYGFAGSMQAGGLAILSVANGWIHDHTMEVHKGYFWTEVFLLTLSVIALVINGIIFIKDKRRGTGLDLVGGRDSMIKERAKSSFFDNKVDEDDVNSSFISV